MDKVRIPSGGVRSNVRAGADIVADRVVKYNTDVNEVVVCGSGEEADAIVLEAVSEGEILNQSGVVYGRSVQGVFDNIAFDGTITVGGEWMSGAAGILTAYVVSGDNRPLGKVLKDNGDGTAKVSFYGK